MKRRVNKNNVSTTMRWPSLSALSHVYPNGCIPFDSRIRQRAADRDRVANVKMNREGKQNARLVHQFCLLFTSISILFFGCSRHH